MIYLEHDMNTCGIRVSFVLMDAAMSVELPELPGRSEDGTWRMAQTTETLESVKLMLEAAIQEQRERDAAQNLSRV